MRSKNKFFDPRNFYYQQVEKRPKSRENNKNRKQFNTGDDVAKSGVFIYVIGNAKTPKFNALKHTASTKDLEKSILSDAIKFEYTLREMNPGSTTTKNKTRNHFVFAQIKEVASNAIK